MSARNAPDQELIDRLQQQLASAQAAHGSAVRLLAEAAHDLKQPVDALRIYAQALNENPGLAAELAPRLARAADSLKDMVASVLELALLKSGAVPLAPSPIDLRGMFQDLQAVYEPLARQKGLALRLKPIDAALVGDAAALHRLLGNLLANAIGHTERGGVLLAARRRADAISLEVWDTGIGIAPQDQEHVFEPFVRLGHLQAAGGAGLGLAIVRALSARLGWQVSLRSRPGRGSVFRVLTGSAGRSSAQSAGSASGS